MDKYLVAGDDRVEIRQSRNGSSKKARWIIEVVNEKDNHIRLKSCHGRYLTATATPFLLGMTGNRVTQAKIEVGSSEWAHQWEVIRDGFQVKLKSWCGTYLRGNGGTPPWRNSVTHDEPHSSATQNWVLWDVENVDVVEDCDDDHSVSSSLSDDFCVWEPPSPMSVISVQSPMKNSKLQVRVYQYPCLYNFYIIILHTSIFLI